MQGLLELDERMRDKAKYLAPHYAIHDLSSYRQFNGNAKLQPVGVATITNYIRLGITEPIPTHLKV